LWKVMSRPFPRHDASSDHRHDRADSGKFGRLIKAASSVDPVERENTPLQARVAKLKAELDTSRRVIEVHGKLSALLEQLATGGATDEGPAK
jgi:hypothetical protein